MSVPDIHYHIRKYPHTCDTEVTRKGNTQTCNKTAVAVAVDTENGAWWPVCAHHSRGRPMVPLWELLKVLG